MPSLVDDHERRCKESPDDRANHCRQSHPQGGHQHRLAAHYRTPGRRRIGLKREITAGESRYRQAFAAIDSDPAHLLVVGELNGDAVATFQLSFIPGLSHRGALRAQIEGVRVSGQVRGLGVGTIAIQWAIDFARDHGCTIVQLTTDKTRTGARRFYERLGFLASHEGMKLTLHTIEPA